MLIQVFLIIFFIFAIIKVISRYQAGELSWRGLSVWVLFWLAAGVVVLLPNSAAYLAKLVGIGRGADLVVYVALTLLFFVIFRLMIKIEQMNRNITKLTRQNALEEKTKDKV
ncbi:MAG: DUF2304 domain-containing protein [Patescibacteria group bacterium]